MLTQDPEFPPPSEESYAPFATHVDFEQAEVFVHHNCTNTMINDQLWLNQRGSQAGEPHPQTMKNAHGMHKILSEASGHQDMSLVNFPHHLQGPYGTYAKVQFTSVEVSVPYSCGIHEEDRTYTIHCQPVMEAILGAIEDPNLCPQFIFYPE